MRCKILLIISILSLAINCSYAIGVTLSDTSKLKSIPDDIEKCNLLNDLSDEFRNVNTDKGLEYGNKGLTLSKKLKYKEGIARSLKLIGTNLWIMGIYDIALDNYLNSLRLYKELKDTISLCKVYNNLGLVYFARSEPKLARENYAIALRLARQINSDTEQARILTNMALLEREQGSVEKAIDYHYEGLKFANLSNSQFMVAYNKCYIGKCYNTLKKYDSVSKFLDESLAIFDSLGSFNDVAMNYNIYAEHYIDINDYPKALEFANKGLKLSQSIGSGFTTMESTKLVSDAYKGMNNYEQALKYRDSYFDLAFAMNNESKIKSIAQIEAKHKYDEKLMETELKNLEKLTASREFLTIAIVISIVLLISLSLIIIIYRIKVKHNQLLTIKNDEITVLNLQLREVIASKDKFFTILAHDLRSPFSGFLGLTKLMSEHINDFSIDDLQEMSSEMQNSADNLYKLLDNLLLWSRMQRGELECTPAPIDLTLIVKQNIDVAYEVAKLKDIEFINNINENTDVLADPGMLNTVFRNLISNAIKFTPNGGNIEIGVSKNIVTAKNQQSQNGNGVPESIINSFVNIYVKDSGIGMPLDMIGKLFKIDENVSRPGTNNEPSTGLGLMICYEFILKHKGKIWVESEVGAGSTFWFSLPTN